MGRDSGVLVLIKLIQNVRHRKVPMVSPTPDIGAQVRHIGGTPCAGGRCWEDAAEHGDVKLSGRGGRLVEPQACLLQAFDRFPRGRHVGARFCPLQARARADGRRAPRSALPGQLGPDFGVSGGSDHPLPAFHSNADGLSAIPSNSGVGWVEPLRNPSLFCTCARRPPKNFPPCLLTSPAPFVRIDSELHPLR